VITITLLLLIVALVLAIMAAAGSSRWQLLMSVSQILVILALLLGHFAIR
jgi:hypothetical protein